MTKEYSPLALCLGSFSALMTARTPRSVWIVAVYVARTCGVSCRGIQLRAPIGSDWVYRNALCPPVCFGVSHCKAAAVGTVRYSILMDSTALRDGGKSMTSALPRMGSGFSM